ncbi:MAG: ferrochelatase [Acetobacteraceae bacterium]|nr:ferrochelatase [Acetobacteraceae bacterium]
MVLFNLGGPDRLEAVRPFLMNLFTDPAILRVPFFIRPFLARIIAKARVKPAIANYMLLGGRSPLLDLTRAQAAALEAALPDINAKCFIAMRYWHPLSDDTAWAVKAWAPDQVLLLPLYPQYSSTTVGSSLLAWREAAARAGLVAPTTTVCCYPTDPAFIEATASLVQVGYQAARDTLDPRCSLRVLFSAHGLPQVIIRHGDPYQWQVEQTVTAIVTALGIPELDWTICYQSRATPQKWIGPSTDAEVERAGRNKVAVLVVPIAFVSEHSETLVELDVEYKHLADRSGVPGYFRVPTQNTDGGFINALARLALSVLAQGPGVYSHMPTRICPAGYQACPHK